MQTYSILWADDEIDLLKPYIIFLESKGYKVTAVVSGGDALDEFKDNKFDVVFLDENMPGMSGLETLAEIKNLNPDVPVVMITKSEEEHIMEEAIGSKIADYLIKPLNPNQILMSVKKILDKEKLVSEKTNTAYMQEFRNISMAFGDNLSHEQWAELYKKLIFWELEIEESKNRNMFEVLQMQKQEANANFTKFVKKNYESWLNDPKADAPMLSAGVMTKRVFPLLQKPEPVVFLLVDNLRYDQWKVIKNVLSPFYDLEDESHFYSILPTTTAYARNSIFAGMMPDAIKKKFPQLWVEDDEDDGKNNSEEQLLAEQLKKLKDPIKFTYHKITNQEAGKQLAESYANLFNFKFSAVVYNFVDMLSHARTDMAVIKELAPDEAAYRSVAKSWFEHSPLLDLLRQLAQKPVRLVITTDHGTVKVGKPHKIIGDKNTNTNLRYKQGRNLNTEEKDIFYAPKPERLHLPTQHMTTSYAFATEDRFFCYPNNYNYYANHYRDTFQHGGISLEEMIVPFAVLKSKS